MRIVIVLGVPSQTHFAKQKLVRFVYEISSVRAPVQTAAQHLGKLIQPFERCRYV